MDPLSITVACVGLLTSIQQLCSQITTFVSTIRDARNDMDLVARELSSLSLCLETLRDDSTRLIYPENLHTRLHQVIGNIDQITNEMERLLSKLSSRSIGRRVQWSIMGQDDMNKLRLSLEAHKSAIDIALEMGVIITLSKVKADTAAIKRETEQIKHIKEDTSQISKLREEFEVIRVQILALQDRSSQENTVLKAFLDESKSFTATILDLEELSWPSLDVDTFQYERWPRAVMNPDTEPGRMSCPRTETALSLNEDDACVNKEMTYTDRNIAELEASETRSVLLKTAEWMNTKTPSKPPQKTTSQSLICLAPDDQEGVSDISSPNQSAIPAPKDTQLPSSSVSLSSIRDSEEILLARASRSRLPQKGRKQLDGTLVAAVKRGKDEEVVLLLRQGADPQATTRYLGEDWPVLYAACTRNDLSTVRSLLAYGAYVNCVTGPDRRTALGAACRSGAEFELIHLLLQAGADAKLGNWYHHSHLGAACASGAGIEVIRLLLAAGADLNPSEVLFKSRPLCQAARRGDVELFSLFLSHGADLPHALRGACWISDARAVRFLLEHGADANGRIEAKGTTMLQVACEAGSESAVQVLLEYGADVGASSSRFKSAFKAAESCGSKTKGKLIGTVLEEHQLSNFLTDS